MGFGSHGHSHGQSHGHSHENHNHHHGHSHEKKSKFCGCCHLSEKFRLSSMLGMTFLFFLVELVIGQITKSVALTTDAFHMLSDTLALFIGLFSVIVSDLCFVFIYVQIKID
jgi:Co/Zn/Cd efflux system component